MLTLQNASLNEPEAGLKLHQLGGRSQQWFARKLKVGRSTQFLHKQFLQKEKKLAEIDAQWLNCGQICTVRWQHFVRSNTVTLADRDLDCTVSVLTVGTVITVQNPT